MAIKRWWTTAVAALSSMLVSAVVYAQDAPIDVTVNTPSPWYGQWYVWAIGVGVFLIIVIALTNRGSRQT